MSLKRGKGTRLKDLEAALPRGLPSSPSLSTNAPKLSILLVVWIFATCFLFFKGKSASLQLPHFSLPDPFPTHTQSSAATLLTGTPEQMPCVAQPPWALEMRKVCALTWLSLQSLHRAKDTGLGVINLEGTGDGYHSGDASGMEFVGRYLRERE